MGPVEELGLLKMDFLGLSNLTIVKNTLRIIKKVYKEDVDLSELPLDDPKTYELLQRGDTTGVFQFESAGMKRYLKDLKPTEFGDIVAMGALYRPGPLSAGLTDSFIRRKNGLEKVTYDHPKMKSALESTYGVLVYQEQFMQISRDVCGFTGGEADTLRKAIGKKKRDMMLKMEKRFIEGAVENGIDRKLILDFWNKLMGFADYCFNKSHSACYGQISYWTAYLKANYPTAFMAALMTSDFDDIDRLAIEINECKHMGITVLPPDVNESFIEFAVVKDDDGKEKIRFGMNAVKNVGTSAVEEILRARGEGKFTSLEDFLTRVSHRIVNKKAIESLIKTGAFDKFGDRSLLLNNIETIVAHASRIQKDINSGQTDLFGTSEVSGDFLPKLVLDESMPEFTGREQLIWERELLGLYLSRHPLSDYETFLNENCLPIKEIEAGHEGKLVKIGGSVLEFKEIITKNGAKMAFVTISDMSNEVELILFPGAYQQTIDIWAKDNVVLVNGKVSTKDRDGNTGSDIKILVDDAREITHAQVKAYQATGRTVKIPKISASKKSVLASAVAKAKAEKAESEKPTRLFVRVSDTSDTQKLESMKRVLDAKIGNTEVVLVLGPESNKQLVKLPSRVEAGEDTINDLAEIFGNGQVKLH
jgi:DNA polymerase-3 subunit alpha